VKNLGLTLRRNGATMKKNEPHATAQRRNGATKGQKKKSMTENEIARHIMDAAFFLKHSFKRVVNGLEDL
jgi:hypothetical protein